jgi:hypothetical protein
MTRYDPAHDCDPSGRWATPRAKPLTMREQLTRRKLELLNKLKKAAKQWPVDLDTRLHRK